MGMDTRGATYKMTDRYYPTPRVQKDPHAEDPCRRMSASRIMAIVEGTVTSDIVTEMPKDADGTWHQLIATGHTGTRAIAVVVDIQRHESLDDAIRELGSKILMDGETADDYRASPDAPASGPVVSFSYVSAQTAPPQAHAVPPAEPGMTRNDTRHLQGSRGNMGVISVHSTDLHTMRRIIVDARSGADLSPDEIARAQAEIVDARTIVVLDRLVPEERPKRVGSYEFNSAPMAAYKDAAEFGEDPDTIRADNGVEFQWKGVPVLLTQGREAIRCLLYRAFGHLVLVYERQIEVLPITLLRNGGVSCGLTIGNPEITVKLFEAANALLEDEGDVAIIAVYTPETASTTTNIRVGWFYVEGTLPPARVSKAYEVAEQESLVLGSRAEAAAYMRENWRNFVHARFADGRQITIMDPRMRYASRASALPLQGIKLEDCQLRGGGYMASAMLGAVRAVVDSCAFHATIRDQKDRANPLHDTLPLFFDQEGSLRYLELRKFLSEKFSEVSRQGGAHALQIDPDFSRGLDAVEPMMVRYVFAGNPRDRILSRELTAREVHDSFMERFIRALITTIYISYGNHANMALVSAGSRIDRLHLAHMIYRSGFGIIESRERVFRFLDKGYDWLQKKPRESFSQDFLRVWDDAERHCRVRGSRGAPGPTGNPHRQAPNNAVKMSPAGALDLHKELLITYVMNRSNSNFLGLASFLEARSHEWARETAVARLAARGSAPPVGTGLAPRASERSAFTTRTPART
jgi:hypothetical protein